jgi:hypothetical protein
MLLFLTLNIGLYCVFWARLIQKIYEVEPLVCPKCKGSMRIIGRIEDPSVIGAILDHLEI